MHSSTVTRPYVLTLRHAGRRDLPGVLALLAEAAEWLHARGIRQWPRGGFGAERIEPLIEESVLYVAETAAPDGEDASPALTGPRHPYGGHDLTGQEGPARELIAVVAVDDHADPEFWTPADDPASALYVHKLAVSRRAAGRGVGEALLDWAGRQALLAGRPWLRLDCAKNNTMLQNYYRGRLFTHVRTVDLPHRASGALFQRPSWVDVGPAVTLLDRTIPHRHLVRA